MMLILCIDHGNRSINGDDGIAPLKILLTHSFWLSRVQIGNKNLATTRSIQMVMRFRKPKKNGFGIFKHSEQ